MTTAQRQAIDSCSPCEAKRRGKVRSKAPSISNHLSVEDGSRTHSSTTGSLVDHGEELLFELSSEIGSRLWHLDDGSCEDLEEETRVGLFLGLESETKKRKRRTRREMIA